MNKDTLREYTYLKEIKRGAQIKKEWKDLVVEPEEITLEGLIRLRGLSDHPATTNQSENHG